MKQTLYGDKKSGALGDACFTQGLPVTIIFRASAQEMEPLSQSKMFTVWALKTSDPLKEILGAEYFNEAVGLGLRKHDRIEVVANADCGAEYASLVITDVREGKYVTAKPLSFGLVRGVA